ncbi:hypothetical protein [Paraliomyxa miuraensis]|uniref:hypothetical protein n=1 Tax=Paraliomyxa miuraensis TaxID=376150 RepID=UPI00225B8CFE|nr:hypothetical protein [Paraliomyxa miuraensis]MCX4239254.1 hypothetical protein [Paraliomyxa miuraensis]
MIEHARSFDQIDPISEWSNLLLVCRREASSPKPWQRAVLNATTDDSARRAFRALYSELKQLRQCDAFDEISSVLGVLAKHSSGIHPLLLVAGLRLTCLYRTEVADWTRARDQIAESLSSRGLDSSELLCGLLN